MRPFKNHSSNIGMIGSKRKVIITKNYLKKNSIPEEKIEQIDMPIGFDLKAHTPQEIAISILGKIIYVKNQKLHS